MTMRLTLIALIAVTLAAVGCGGDFKLPTETVKTTGIPSDESYQMVATWSGMSGVTDILVTQGAGTQLFVLFNRGGVGTAPRGEVVSYPRLTPTGTPTPIAGISFAELFNPIALCSGGDGIASLNNRVYVLDRGDTCLARQNPMTGTCDTTGAFDFRITDISSYWHVREYGLLGGAPIGSFSDTALAYVNGVAADAEGRVYVSGLAIIKVPDQQDPRRKTRLFQWRIYRYERGPKYPGIPDLEVVGDWHRDSTFVSEEGSGVGTVVDPRGIFWGPGDEEALYVADFNKNWVQKVNIEGASVGFYQVDGAQSGAGFNGPVDVVADLQDFIYIADTGNSRVLRYDGTGLYVQDVNVELDAFGSPLVNPVAVAANDSLVFVGDADLGRVVRYKRRR